MLLAEFIKNRHCENRVGELFGFRLVKGRRVRRPYFYCDLAHLKGQNLFSRTDSMLEARICVVYY